MSYAFAFYVGHIFIIEEIKDTASSDPYTSGDVMACFFGIIFGFFSLGMAAPNIKAVTEGQVAGNMAFDIIDRQPAVRNNDKIIKSFDKGELRFEKCDFSYASRKD